MKKGWQTKKLGDLLEVQNGYAFSSKDYSESGHFLMRISNVQNGYISPADPKFIKLPVDGALQRFALSEGDILVSLTGNVGRVGVIQAEHLPAALNQRVARISIRKGSPATRELLLFFLFSDWFREELMGAGHGAAQQNVSTKDLVEIEIPVPPLPDQQRIVGILDEAFDGIAKARANAEQNLQNARALFESHLQFVFTQRGKGWVAKSIGEVCRTGAGGTPLKSKKEYYQDGNIPWLMSGEVSQGEILSATKFITRKGLENSSARMFPKDTVLVAMYGATAGAVGILRFEASTNQAVCGILPNDKFVPEFLFYVLLSKKSDLVDQATGNAQPNISQIKIKNTEIPVITLPEQRRIVATFNALRAETQRLESLYQRKLAALDALKKSLLHQAFTGML